MSLRSWAALAIVVALTAGPASIAHGTVLRDGDGDHQKKMAEVLWIGFNAVLIGSNIDAIVQDQGNIVTGFLGLAIGFGTIFLARDEDLEFPTALFFAGFATASVGVLSIARYTQRVQAEKSQKRASRTMNLGLMQFRAPSRKAVTGLGMLLTF